MKKRILGLLLGGVVVAGIGACNPNLSSWQVLGIVPPSDQCIYSGQATVFQPEVIVDLNVARSAFVGMLGRNSMVPSQSNTARLTELRTILVEGANLRYRTEPFTRLAERYVHTSGSISPGQGSAPMLIEVLSARDIDVLRGDARLQSQIGAGQGTAVIVINAKFDGRITDGSRIQASEVPIPVRLCRGCLRGFPPAVPAGKTLAEVCSESTVNVPCNAGQDDVIDFCLYEAIRR